MLDAASLLMNQYATIAPVIVPQQPPSTTLDSSSITDSISKEKTIPPEPSVELVKEVVEPETEPSPSTSKVDLKEEVTIEDLGADEDHIKNQTTSATNMSSLITPTTASSSDSPSSTDLSEVRRRWNEKFAQNNTTQSQ